MITKLENFSHWPRYLVLILVLAPVGVKSAPAEDMIAAWGEVLAEQIQADEPLPVMAGYGIDIDLPQAYGIQRRLLEDSLSNQAVIGYAAAFTNPARRYYYALYGPISGVLLADHRAAADTTLRLSEFTHLVVKMELGFILDQPIEKNVPDVYRLKPLIRAVVPVLSFSDINFEQPGEVSGKDLIAANLSTRVFIAGGPFFYQNDAVVTGVFVELSLNGEIVDRGKGVNLMGDPYKAVLWLINQQIEQGRTLEAGQIMLTGALGDASRVRAGEYIADFWKHEKLRITVLP